MYQNKADFKTTVWLPSYLLLSLLSLSLCLTYGCPSCLLLHLLSFIFDRINICTYIGFCVYLTGSRGEGLGEGSGGGLGGVADEKQMRSPLMIIESFLAALTSADKDGRVVITKAGLSLM